MKSKITHCCLLLFCWLLFPFFSQAQNLYWESISKMEAQKLGDAQISTKAAQTHRLDVEALRIYLQNAPSGKSFEVKNSNFILAIPMPSREMLSFRILESSILSSELAKKLPQVKTYVGQALNDSRIQLRMDITQHGFHAIIFSPEGTIYIDPYQKGNTQYYITYWKKDFLNTQKAAINEGCQFEENKKDTKYAGKSNNTEANEGDETAARPSGTQLRTYRLAVAATGEYTQFHNDGNAANGNAVADAQAAIITTFNRVTGIYEKEVAVSFILVDNSSIVFADGTTDPFSNTNAGALINESQTIIDNNIGFINYDVGHTVSTGGGGLAGLGVICTTSKARGITGLGQPIGDPFDVDYVAHEVGHQFGGSHTFNGNAGSCSGGNRSASSAYEPGSGTTIMAYAGICAPENTQNNSDDYFHTRSFDQILTHTLDGSGNNCPTTTNTGNSVPVVSVPTGGFTIPINTPFELSGSATDANGDVLSYSWEQFDLGPAGAPTNPSLDAPIFRSFSPKSTPTRTFPRIEDIVSNTATFGEILPSYTRNLNFRLIVRDNQTVGGVDYASIGFSVSSAAGPFLVTAPNTTLTWAAGSSQKVTWDVANTDKAPINCQSVNILLSTDGGLTYPITLASNTPNNGSRWIAVPNQATTQARIKVQAADNIFFDISNQNFTITAATAPTFTLTVGAESALACAPANVQYNISIGSILAFSSSVNLSTGNLPAGLNATFGQNPINPVANTTLIIGNTSSLTTGTYSFEVVATSVGITRSIPLTLVIVNGVPTPVTLQSPTNGGVNVSLTPIFNWIDSPGTTDYILEVATNLSFANIILQENSSSSDFELTTPLSFNTTYYWRVRANNACGNSSISTTASFTTFSPQCFTYTATDLPIVISNGPPNTINSVISITDDFQITDVNIVNITGTHTYISDLTFTLISPNGTEIIMMNRPCNDENNFNLGFDDEASSTNLPCPPVNGNSYIPFEDLSSFIGENSVGNWTLLVTDNANFDGGSLTSWALELCTIGSNNTPPTITNNQKLLVTPGESSYALNSINLQATDNEDEDDNLLYLIEQMPVSGTLKQNNSTLIVGSLFTQGELHSGEIKYHPNAINTSFNDTFRFRVRDSGSSSTAVTTFNISLNYPPVLITNEPLIDIPGQSSYTITPTLLSSADVEDNDNSLIYYVSQATQNGKLQISGVDVIQGNTFTQNNINAQVVKYIPSSVTNGAQDTFKFKVRDSAGNETTEATFAISVDIVNNLQGNPLQTGTEISPNPSEGIFKVSLNFAYQGNLDLEVISIEGKTLKKLSVQKNTANTEFEIDLSELASGMYFLKIQNNEAQTIKRLMKK